MRRHIDGETRGKPSGRAPQLTRRNRAGDHALFALQSTAGNHAVSSLLSPRPSPVQREYTHIEPYAAGIEISDEGEFVGQSDQELSQIRHDLKKSGKSTSEREVRISLIDKKVREAWRMLRTAEAKRYKDDNRIMVLGVFTAPEWVFKRPNTPFNEDDRDAIVNYFRALSGELRDLMIVPGSVIYEPHASTRKEKILLHNAVVFLNGSLVKSTFKRANAGDTVGYWGDTTAEAQEGGMPKEFGGLGPSLNEKETFSKAQMAYGRARGKKVASEVGNRTEGDSSLFEVGELTFSLEVCQDHGDARAKADVAAAGGNHPGVHVQILISHGAMFGKQRSALRPGGVAITNDAGANAGRELWAEGKTKREKRVDLGDEQGSFLTADPIRLRAETGREEQWNAIQR